MMQTYYEEHTDEINNPDQNDQDLMNNEEIASRTKELLAAISKAERELQEVRSNCRHKARTVKSIIIKDSSNVRVICDDCQSIVGYPSTKQIDEWNKR